VTGSAAVLDARPVYRARGVWVPAEGGGGAVLADHAVEVSATGRVVAVRPARAGDGPALDGLIVPGLVNAHTHLELSARGLVPGGDGFVPWARRLLTSAPPGREEAASAGRAAARALLAGGTAIVGDVSNGGHTGAWLAAAGLRGVVHHEAIGFDVRELPARLRAVRREAPVAPGVVRRPAPHALFSTHPQLVAAAVRAGRLPASLHVGESADEASFLADGIGPHAALLDALGRDWRTWRPPGTDAVAYLAALGILGPRLLLVHGVHLGPAAVRRAAVAGARLASCPRSNLHVTGRLPDLPRWVAHGVPLALGTDGRVSAPDLDVLAEVAVLIRAFPAVPPATWLTAATHGGARAIGLQGAAAIVPGARPGLLWLHGVGGPGGLARVPARSWLRHP
jgi:cytosine/adenosine deaminase-related metal-dependent hydrolase